MNDSTREGLSATTSNYAKTHCKICAAGWTRTGINGEEIIICLLDREQVWQAMEKCSRYERMDGTP